MTEDTEMLEMLEEAEEDLKDAEDLGRRPQSFPMSLYQASQSAEKFLRVLARHHGRDVPVHWDLGRVFEAVRDLAGLQDLAEPVGRLAGHATPGRQDPGREMVAEGLRTALKVRYCTRTALGQEVSPPPEEVTVAPEVERGDGEGRAPRGEVDAPRPRRDPSRPGTGLVQSVWLCDRCGVRLPRTRQTGRSATCPHCNRPMRLIQGH